MESAGKYDPTEFSRSRTGERDSDSSGRTTKNQGFSVQFHTRDGVHAVPLSFVVGAVHMNLEKTQIQWPFSGLLYRDGKWQDGVWVTIVDGVRLDALLEELAEGKKRAVHITGPVDDPTKSQVNDLAIEPLGDGI